MPGTNEHSESGTVQQCRFRRTRTLVTAGAALLLAACASGPAAPTDPEVTDGAQGETATDTAGSPDPALASACGEFWGDPDYAAPLSRVVLDRAATAPEAGPSDPFFYAMTGDDIEAVFDDAPEQARTAATDLAQWFRTQPEKGSEADRDAFGDLWQGLAAECADVSAAASWAADPEQEGDKPAALVCADVYDTPGTFTHFGNANVLTSNMFYLVGLSAQQVPADRLEDVQATADLLEREIDRVDDDAVRAGLEQVRAPFQQALEGDLWSEGLREPLTELGSACDDAGYRAPESGELGDKTNDQDDDGGLV